MKGDASKTQPIAVTTSGMTTVRANPALVHEHWEPLSNLDIFIPKEDVDVILCYEKPNVTFDSMVATLKKSLAETLVEYYVFAGELAFNESSSELEILCNNHGVDFVEASVDLEFKELDLHKPHEVLEGKLTSSRKNGTFSVQVTEFVRCGSIVVACKFHHTVADGYSTNMFLVSWSENALLKALSHPPSRLIFHPRSPPKCGQNVEKYFYPISSLPPPFIRNEQDTNSSRVYYITADQTIAIQEAASTTTSKRTKLESFSAFLWQLLAKSAFQENSYTTNANIKGKDLITKMGITVDGRTRLTSVHEPQSCISYFGNVISAPYGSETLDTISHKPLTWVAEKVAQVIKVGTNKDHFLDLIDLVGTIHPEITVLENFWPRSTDGPKVVVSSGLRFRMGKTSARIFLSPLENRLRICYASANPKWKRGLDCVHASSNTPNRVHRKRSVTCFQTLNIGSCSTLIISPDHQLRLSDHSYLFISFDLISVLCILQCRLLISIK